MILPVYECKLALFSLSPNLSIIYGGGKNPAPRGCERFIVALITVINPSPYFCRKHHNTYMNQNPVIHISVLSYKRIKISL